MRKILVTGGAGHIGSALVKRLSQNKDNFLVVVDSLLTGKRENIEHLPTSQIAFYNIDVNRMNDLSEVIKKYKFDYIFHYAAMVGVERTLRRPLDVLNDMEGIKNILALAYEHKVRKIFFASSSEVYGETTAWPQHEITTPLNARLPYSVVKKVGETFLRAYGQEHNLDFTIFRFFNTYSAYQSDDFVIPRFVNLALNDKSITLYGNGSQTRTFCYIDDNIDATAKIFEDNLLSKGTINIGNDSEITIKDLAKLIIKKSGSKSSIQYLPALKEGDVVRRLPDVTQMKNILNRRLLDLEQGIQLTIENKLKA